MTEIPNIRPVKWARLRDVLPNEATDFTPWLAGNLELLADALGLEELELVRTESAVESYRVDVLATGTDGSGEEIAVVIENQYGKSDHDHLGKIVTYAAQSETEAERVLGVWLVEEPSPAHIAAVEFLNRISVESVGWVLVTAKFIPAPDGYYVHIEKHAEPNAFLREAPRSASRSVRPERVEFMRAVHDLVDQPLRETGFRNVYCHPRGTLIRADLPSHLPAADWVEVRVRARQDDFRVVLRVRGGQAPAEENEHVLERIRERHAQTIHDAVSDPEAIEWHARGPLDRGDLARYTWQGQGYTNADPNAAAQRVISFARACFTAVSGDGRDVFPDPSELESELARADAPTIMAIAEHVRRGEWTTYGDLSTVATGTHTAAIIVGRIAATNANFPNPHRVLTSDGSIPENWSSGDGGGPEVCRERLEAEGIRFLPGGAADPAQRLDLAELSRRWRPLNDQATHDGQP